MSQTIVAGCHGAMPKTCLCLLPREAKTSGAWAWDCPLPGAVLRQTRAVCVCRTDPAWAVFLPSTCHDTRCSNIQRMHASNEPCGILEYWLRTFDVDNWSLDKERSANHLAMGSVNCTVVPSPILLSAQMVPPCASTMHLEM